MNLRILISGSLTFNFEMKNAFHYIKAKIPSHQNSNMQIKVKKISYAPLQQAKSTFLTNTPPHIYHQHLTTQTKFNNTHIYNPTESADFCLIKFIVTAISITITMMRESSVFHSAQTTSKWPMQLSLFSTSTFVYSLANQRINSSDSYCPTSRANDYLASRVENNIW